MPSSHRLFVVHISPTTLHSFPDHSMHLLSTSSHTPNPLSTLAYFPRQTLSRSGKPRNNCVRFKYILFFTLSYTFPCLNFLPFCANGSSGLLQRAPYFFGLVTIRAYSRPLYSGYSIGTFRFYFLLSFALCRVLPCPIVPQSNLSPPLAAFRHHDPRVINRRNEISFWAVTYAMQKARGM